jgi:hypothetical protein
MHARLRVPALLLALLLGTSSCGGKGTQSDTGIQFTPATGTTINTTAGDVFTQTFSVTTGGDPPFTFTAGTTPPGLSVGAGSTQTGLNGTLSFVLSGTPSQQGLYTLTVNVVGANGASQEAAWSIEVGQANPPLTVTPAALPGATLGQPYSQLLTVQNGMDPITWTVSDPQDLPPGIATVPSTGVTFRLSGTPTTQGTFSFTVTVSDGSTPPRTAILSLSITVT